MHCFLLILATAVLCTDTTIINTDTDKTTAYLHLPLYDQMSPSVQSLIDDNPGASGGTGTYADACTKADTYRITTRFLLDSFLTTQSTHMQTLVSVICVIYLIQPDPKISSKRHTTRVQFSCRRSILFSNNLHILEIIAKGS